MFWKPSCKSALDIKEMMISTHQYYTSDIRSFLPAFISFDYPNIHNFMDIKYIIEWTQ